MANILDCCSSYKECSIAGECLHTCDSEYASCSYRKNLESGQIFYGIGTINPKTVAAPIKNAGQLSLFDLL